MPITAAVQRLLEGRVSAREAFEQLMGREPKHESVR
jgi:glycerol-3-phosphate dehydrogenase